MKNLLVSVLVLSAALLLAVRSWQELPVNAEGGGAGITPSGNGDVNCDGAINISDASYLLGWLFLGSDAPCAFPEPGLEDERIAKGFAIAPVPLQFDEKNRDLVGLGSYIVNASGDCNGCHTTAEFDPYLPGGNPFRGEPAQINPDRYLVGGAVFGPFVSRDLRPDPVKKLPAGYTFEEFLLVLRTGVDLKMKHPAMGPLLQVMPWPNFRDMTDHDLRAIYEYLLALPPAST